MSAGVCVAARILGERLLGPERFYELRYEDLTKDPAGEMRKLYDHFHFGGYAEFLPRLQSYLASVNGYETNKYQVTPEQRAAIGKRWGEVIARYGY